GPGAIGPRQVERAGGGDLRSRCSRTGGVPMDVSGWGWAGTAAFVVGLITFDFFAHVRTPHAPTFSESVKWSIFYIALALVFGLVVGMGWGWEFGTEYYAG